ncbi:hypothetical protein D3C83_33240 [compost metagenome]
MLLLGRLPGATAFAPPRVKSKSVSWLLRRKPRTTMRLPNGLSTEVVIATASPYRSTIEKWLVPRSTPPGCASPIERSPISDALDARYAPSRSFRTGTGTKSASPR